MNGDDLERRNLRFGWALFGLFWLLFVGTFLVALLYLHWTNRCADRNPLARIPVAREALKASASRPLCLFDS